MPAPVVDRVRPAPQAVAGVAPAPKPAHRFDDVLNSRRSRVKPVVDEPTPTATPKQPDPTQPTSPTDSAQTVDTENVTAEPSAEVKPTKSAPEEQPAPDDDAPAVNVESEVTDAQPTPAAAPAMTPIPLAVDADADEADADIEAITPVDEATTAATAEIDPAALPLPLATVPAPVVNDAPAPTRPITDDAAAAVGPVTVKSTPNDPVQVPVEPAAPEKTKRPSVASHDTPPDDAGAEDLAAMMLPADADDAFDAVDADKLKAVLERPVSEPAVTPAPPPDKRVIAAPPAAAPEAPPRTVAEDNVDRIVTSVRGELLTKGGAMQIRLDPPTLGTINVQINVDGGVFSASLQTTNDEATRMLSHNLSQLKSQLESAGVTVDRIQVRQAAPGDASSNPQNAGDSDSRQHHRDAGQDQSGRQEQQRREMLQRMWARVAGDPLDLVA